MFHPSRFTLQLGTELKMQSHYLHLSIFNLTEHLLYRCHIYLQIQSSIDLAFTDAVLQQLQMILHWTLALL